MRCPHCEFVAFRDIEKCPSCGGVMRTPVRSPGGRLASEAKTEDDGPLASYSTVEDVAGPLVDYSLRAPESFVPASRRRSPRPTRAAVVNQAAGGVASRASVRPEKKRSLGLDVSADANTSSPVEGFAPEQSIARQLLSRLVAGVIDIVLLCGVNATIIYFTTRLVGLPLASVAQLPLPPLVAFLTVFNVGYAVTLTAICGQTIGKMAVGLRVEVADGSRITPVHVVIRTVAYLVSVLPFGVGFVGMFLRSHRALHDLLADTRVVRLS